MEPRPNLIFRKRVRTALCAAVCCVLCVGCHRDRKEITAVPRDMAEALWVCEHGGVADAAARAHVGLRWNGPSSEDAVDEQIAIAEKAIDKDAYGLIVSPNSLFAMNTVMQRALRKEIPVVVVGTSLPLSAGDGLTFVLNDVNVAGQLAAERVNAVLRDGDEVLMTGLDPTWPGSEDRARSFEKKLNEIAPHIHIADKLSGAVSFGQAELQAEKALREHPKIGMVVSLNITSTRGAVAAVSTLRAADHIRVMGFDQTLDLLTGLRQGRVDALVVQDMRKMGAIAVERVVSARQGEHPPARTLVTPMLVTRANIDTEVAQQVLRMDWRPRP